jgi:hypothetical protein
MALVFQENIPLSLLTKGHSFDCKIMYLLPRVDNDFLPSLMIKAVKGKLRHVSIAVIV